MINIPLVPAPPTWLALLEPTRALVELGSLLPAHALLKQQPKGDGHAVMVLPGFMTGDVTTVVLRRYLHGWGYRARRWKLGLNLGPHVDEKLEERMLDRLESIYHHTGRKISLVGWSLGGIYARELARECPEYVRQVVTLGSPVAGMPKATKVWRLYEMVAGRPIDDEDILQRIDRIVQPVEGVPVTSIYSRSDGIVSPDNAQLKEHPMKQNIEVIGSHIGMALNPFVLYLVADRLAQTEDGWSPFEIDSWRHYFYRDPQRQPLPQPNPTDKAAPV